MNLGLSEPLPSLVRQKYESARSSGALIFSSTQLAIVDTHDARRHGNFQVRYCPALDKKPTQGKRDDNDEADKQGDKKRFNPFENPDPDLLVAAVPATEPTHNLVLNKYPIIPQHFILATKEFKKQTDLLRPVDLGMAYATVKAWEQLDETSTDKLFAFFNSGPESGASQPHRHIQFLPFREMQRDVSAEKAWQPVIQAPDDGRREALGSLRALEMSNAYRTLPPSASVTPDVLYGAYIDLMKSNVGLGAASDESPATEPETSYNLALTSDRIGVVKRTNETYVYKDGAGQDHPISVNGTILAGTLVVRGKEEFEWLRQDPEHLRSLLRTLGDATDQHGPGSVAGKQRPGAL